MQGLTDPPRDALTADQVRGLLIEHPAPRYDRGLELLDASLNVVKDLTGSFQGAQVIRTMAATVHGSCQLNLADDVDVDWGTQLLRPYLTISDGTITARFNTGAYRAAAPTTDLTTVPGTSAVQGSDRLVLLDRPVGDAYRVTAGTGYLAAVTAAITAAGLDPATLLLDGSASAKVLPADKSWPLLADSASSATLPADATPDDTGATTWLQIVNELLAAIGYRGLWADQDGYLRAQPYLAPSQRSIDFAFDFDDPNFPMITPDRQAQTDQSTPVNVWIFQQSNLADANGNPVEPTEGVGQYTVTNQSNGPTSIDAQGGFQWVSVVPLDAADQTSLQAQGDAVVAAALSSATQYAVTSAPFPLAWHYDIYTFADQRMIGGSVTVESVAWTLDLGDSTTVPADMQHTWQST